MRIGYVSTYPPIECGIATYTRDLNNAILKLQNETFIVSQSGAQGENVYSVFDPDSASIGTDVYNFSAKLTPDIIHIQHEFGLYGSQKGVQVIEIVLRFELVGVPVITTLHTVYPDYSEEQKQIIRLILNESSGTIVHEDYQKEILTDLFGKQFEPKIHVIHHGVRENVIDDEGKKKLKLEGKKVILLCGYFRPKKGFHRIVDIFPKVVKEIDNAVLLIAGKSRGLEYKEYQRDFFQSINHSPVTDKILVLRGQFPQHTFDAILSSADLVCLPYEKSGQSGILAQCFAHYKPVVTSDLKPFRVILDQSHGGIVASDDDKMTDAIIKILSDDNYRMQLGENIKNYVEQDVCWSKVADSHIKVYQSLIRVPYGKARHVFWE